MWSSRLLTPNSQNPKTISLFLNIAIATEPLYFVYTFDIT